MAGDTCTAYLVMWRTLVRGRAASAVAHMLYWSDADAYNLQAKLANSGYWSIVLEVEVPS